MGSEQMGSEPDWKWKICALLFRALFYCKGPSISQAMLSTRRQRSLNENRVYLHEVRGALGFRGRWGNVFCKLPKRGGHQWLPATKSAPHTLRHHRHPPRRTSPPPPTAKKTERPSNTSAHDLAATPFNLSLVVLEGSPGADQVSNWKPYIIV